MITDQLRPLSTGEILDGAIVLLRRNFALLFGVAVACEGIPTALNVYIELAGGPVQNLGLGLLYQVLTVIGAVLVTGATVFVVSEAYLGQMPQFGEAMRFAGRRFGTIFGASILSGLVTFLAMLALIIPGIIVACGYSVSSAAAALESGSSTEAVQRSWALTKGFKWKALALGVVTIGLFIVLFIGVGVLGGLAAELMGGLDTALTLLAAFISLLLYPVLSCVFTLFYYDLRVRKEAFDVDMLSRQMSVVS